MSKLRIPNIATKAIEPEAAPVVEVAPKPKAAAALVIPEPEGFYPDSAESAAHVTLITEPGAYPDIPNEDYHRNPRLLPGPSLSASGGKLLLDKSPFHFWSDSPMNPTRPAESSKPHLNVGKAAHDMLLLADRWATSYHVLPEGFNVGHERKWAAEIAARDYALRKGKTVLTHAEHAQVEAVAEAIGMRDVARLALSNGEPEVTIVWRDKETGVWLRCRPDWLPYPVIHGGEVRVVSDLKFMAPENCTPAGFSNAIYRFGYHMAAAWYFEGIKAVYGQEPTHWLHIAIEKEFPFSVSLYPLPQADIERGRAQMRIAVARFADCLASNKWPSWAEEPTEVGLPGHARHTIDQYGTRQDAALITANAGD